MMTGAGSLLAGLPLAAAEQSDLVKLLHRFAPTQAGALWIGILVTVLVAADFRRLLSLRNLAVVLLLLPAAPLVDIMNWGINAEKGDAPSAKLLEAAFSVLFPLTGIVAAWALSLAFSPARRRWSFNLPARGLGMLLALLVALNIIVALSRAGEDAGPYTSLGARRWLETGVLPYGDPWLRGTNTAVPPGEPVRMTPGHGAAATYGPLLYVAHIPFQFLVKAPWNPPDKNPMDKVYQWPPDVATRLTCLFFHLLLLGGIFALTRRLAGSEAGLAATVLYAGSPYVIGLGSDQFLICGLAFISHVAPTAMTLLALAALRRPLTAGLLLAAGAGTLFFPAFFFPLFAGWYFWRRAGTARFVAGFAVGGFLILGLVLLFLRNLDPSLEGQNPITLFLESTVEHQEGTGPMAYGQSQFSFWYPYQDRKAWWQTPLFGAGSIAKPTFLAFAGLCGLSFLLARRRSETQLAALVAMLAAAVQLWKTHAGGTYVEWYLPFLLVALITRAGAPGTEALPAGPAPGAAPPPAP